MDNWDKEDKIFERFLSTNYKGERESCRRAFLRIVAKRLGMKFDPEKRIDPVKEWGIKITNNFENKYHII